MEGSDAGWGRATEPAPRWRALLDRALLGGRTGEQHEVRAAPRTAPDHPSGNGYQARASAPVAYPQDLPYAPAPDFAAPPASYPTSPGYGPAAPGYGPGEVGSPGYGPAGPDYGQPWQDEPAWEDTSTRYSPVTTDNGHSHIEWQETAPDVEVQRAIGVLRRDMGGPRVLAFANPKGGVHKTTATVLAAATVGSVRGRGRARLGRQRAARHARPAGRQRPARPHHPAPDRRPGRGRGAARVRPDRHAGRLPAARLRRLVRRPGRRGEPAVRPAARPVHGAPGARAAAPHARRDLRGHRQQRGERQLADRAAGVPTSW